MCDAAHGFPDSILLSKAAHPGGMEVAVAYAMQAWDEIHGAASGEGPVARIMYASQARITQSVYSEMEKIRHSALKHNEPAGIATALLYQMEKYRG